MRTWTVQISLGGYVAVDHRRAYAAAADWFEEWLADQADDVGWSEVVDEPGGQVDATARLEGFEGDAEVLAEGAANLAATIEEAGMVVLQVSATDADGTVHRLDV